MIIGITGTLGAGKGTIVEYLEKKGFSHYSARAVLLKEIRAKGLPENRDSMITVANELRSTFGPSILAEKMFDMAKEDSSNSIIESLRTLGEVEALRKKEDFVLFAIDANRKIRYDRIIKRKSETDEVSFEDFSRQEDLEMNSTDPNKQNISACIDVADYTFTNNGTFEELYTQIDKVLNSIQNTKEN